MYADILLAALVILLLLIWSIPLVGLVIKLMSLGHVLSIQRCTKRPNRAFRRLKSQIMKHDGRTMSIRKFLWENSLDELPQLLNVLPNDMSEDADHPRAVDKVYWSAIPYYVSWYAVRSGITGLPQFCRAHGFAETTQEMVWRVRYNLYYIQSHSLLFSGFSGGRL
ncbi:sugar transferase [Larkinella arboricola]